MAAPIGAGKAFAWPRYLIGALRAPRRRAAAGNTHRRPPGPGEQAGGLLPIWQIAGGGEKARPQSRWESVLKSPSPGGVCGSVGLATGS